MSPPSVGTPVLSPAASEEHDPAEIVAANVEKANQTAMAVVGQPYQNKT